MEHGPDCCCWGNHKGVGGWLGSWAGGRRCQVALPIAPAQRLAGGGYWALAARHLHTGWHQQDLRGPQGRRRRRREQRASRRWREVGAGGPGLQSWVVLETLATHWGEVHSGNFSSWVGCREQQSGRRWCPRTRTPVPQARQSQEGRWARLAAGREAETRGPGRGWSLVTSSFPLWAPAATWVQDSR